MANFEHEAGCRHAQRRPDPGGIIQSERLVLEPLQGSHAPELCALLQEPRLYEIAAATPFDNAGKRSAFAA